MLDLLLLCTPLKYLSQLPVASLPYETDEFDPTAIPTLRFSAAAQERFNTWLDDLMEEVQSPELKDANAYQEHLNKYPSLMPKLALIFHLVDVASGKTSGAVSLEATELAIAWVDFLKTHARKLYAEELSAELDAAIKLSEKILTAAVDDGMKLSDLYRKGYPGLDSVDKVRKALVVLEDHHRLRVEKTPNPGARPSEFIRVNPLLFQN